MSNHCAIAFRFDKLPTASSGTVKFSGKGRLTILVGKTIVWGDEIDGVVHGFEEYWDSLLLHLARIFPYLWTEQSFPLGYFPESPDQFIDKALSELRWGELPDETVARDEREILAFSKRHNLAEGMPSVHLPYIYLMREGNDLRIVSETVDAHMPLHEAMKVLTELGNEIARAVSEQSTRGQQVLEAWRSANNQFSDDDILSLHAGIPINRLRAIAANDDYVAYFGGASLEQPSPLQIAARMTRAVLLEADQKKVLRRVASIRLTQLDAVFTRLRDQAEQKLARLENIFPYDQGYQLAQWLRNKLKIKESQPVDLENLLTNWGINVTNTRVADSVDAIARWENDRAGILLNRWGLRAKHPWGRRSTLAHELAHLLVDTKHALPAVEVLSRRTDALWEKRANAFAAELLLPSSEVRKALPALISPEAIQPVLDQFSEAFQVGHIIAARQIQNTLIREERLDDETRMFLDRIGGRYGGSESNHWLRA
ncbi:MAG: ImmA/IrrE family metallo-endopeptidase [Magnetococcales bacterium]|nr:ImmA/IrrE family metallo-endopeptidase [Magnetococcales bacterium]